MIRRLFIAFTLLLMPYIMKAQSTAEELYTKAEKAYELGLFNTVDSLLNPTAEQLNGEYRIGAYRLLALSSLYMDESKKAEGYVLKLLEADPYYTAYGDAPRFADLIENTKRGKTATITTASKQAETTGEAPVPVTLITEDMLKIIGARTLKDALIAYVPGMTDIACNEEMNIAMRGIYSSGQEKILIMLNGHRINSYSTNTATPDFSISLEKVKQIEVLRGPASSLYGGVALTGVVNIITKEGSDVDGTKFRLGLGNYGQTKADILFGKKFMKLDIMAWVSLYNSIGQKIHLAADEISQPFAAMPVEGDMIIGGYNKRPSQDYGFTLGLNKINLLFSRRFSKTVAPMSLSFFHAPYSYDKYRKYNGQSPGYAIESQHVELSYADSKNNFTWQAGLSYDLQTQQRYQVDGDTIPEVDMNDVTLNGAEDITLKLYKAVFQIVHWNESALGVNAQGGYNYRFGKHSGNVAVGMHYNLFNLYDAHYLEGVDYDLILKVYNTSKVLNTGTEHSNDMFVQLKHKWNDWLVFNGGLRYDYKRRHSGLSLHEWSPRLAIILTRPKWSAKASYAKSFVDAPYFYRNNTLDINFGDESLRPEYMNSMQFSFLSDKLVKNVYLEANIFFNKATNFIIAEELGNSNAGELTSTGLEVSARYTYDKFDLFSNITWQRSLSSQNYATRGHIMYNIPEFQGNFIASYKIFKNLRIHAHANILSKQYSMYILPGMDPLEINIPARCIVNAGAEYNLKHLGIEFNVYNLGNTKYTQGGSSVAPMRQQGLWFMGNISYTF